MAFEAAKFQVDLREGKGSDLNVQLTLSGKKSEYVDGRPLNVVVLAVRTEQGFAQLAIVLGVLCHRFLDLKSLFRI